MGRTSDRGRGAPAALAGAGGTALVVAFTIVVALAFGIGYGVENQYTYLLSGLRRIDPAFLAHDWLASSTYAYHPTFEWVVMLMDGLGSLVWGLALLNVALTAGTLLLLFQIARRLAPGAAAPAMLLLLLLVLVDRTYSLARSYAFVSYVQPSALAGIALVGAIAAFTAGRWLVAGLLLALSGAFHVNFLLVGLTAFGGAHLLLGRAELPRRLLAQLGPPLVILALDLPMLLAMSTAPEAARSAELFLFVRSPHHYVPARFIGELVPFLGWQLAAAALWRRAVAPGGEERRLRVLLAVFVVLVVVPTVVNTATFIPQLSQLFFWRLAPYAVLLAQLVVCLAAVRLALGWTEGWSASDRRRRAELVVGLAAAGVALLHHIARQLRLGEGLGRAELALGAACVVVLGCIGYAQRRTAARRPISPWPLSLTVAALVAVAALPTSIASLRAPDFLDRRASSAAGLFRWTRERSPLDATFLVPPNMEAFRLGARRAIVVDWKSTPVLPAELVEWHRRVSRVAGRDVRSLADAMAGYATLDEARVAALTREFSVDYVVLRVRDSVSTAALARLPEVYRDTRYVVRAVPASMRRDDPAAAGTEEEAP